MLDNDSARASSGSGRIRRPRAGLIDALGAQKTGDAVICGQLMRRRHSVQTTSAAGLLQSFTMSNSGTFEVLLSLGATTRGDILSWPIRRPKPHCVSADLAQIEVVLDVHSTDPQTHKFPANRENNREFYRPTKTSTLEAPTNQWLSRTGAIETATEQGIKYCSERTNSALALHARGDDGPTVHGRAPLIMTDHLHHPRTDDDISA
jgi:hypothetical protein